MRKVSDSGGGDHVGACAEGKRRKCNDCCAQMSELIENVEVYINR